MSLADVPVWTRDVERALAGTGVLLWSGQPGSSARQAGEPFGLNKTLRQAVEFNIPDSVRDTVYAGRMLSLCLLNDENHVIAGMAIDCEPEIGVFWIDSVFVAPGHRGTGKARQLLDAAIKIYEDMRGALPDKPWAGVEMDGITSGGKALARIAETSSRRSHGVEF